MDYTNSGVQKYTIQVDVLQGEHATIESVIPKIENWVNTVLRGYSRPHDVDVLIDYRSISKYVATTREFVLATARYRANSGATFTYVLIGRGGVADDKEPASIPAESGDGTSEQSS